MRDIRDDLRQRLVALRKEREALQAQLKAKLAEIDQYEEQLDALLALEEKRAGGESHDSRPPKSEKTAAEIDAEFRTDILEILSDGQDWDHGDIKKAMEAKDWTSDASLGRQIQGALLNMSRNEGLIVSLGNSKWRKAKKAVASAA